MAYVLTDTQILVGASELASATAEFEWSVMAEMKEANHLAGQGYKIVLPGLTTGHGNIKGSADFATGAVSSTWNASDIGTQQAFSIVANGSVAVAGSPSSTMSGRLNKIAIAEGSVGNVAGFEIDITGDSAALDGYLALPLATRGAITGSSIQMGAVPAGYRLWAALHVTGGTFTNLAVTIQSDNATGFPSSATAITFATVSAAGWQFLSVAGALTDDWFRAVATIGSGTASYAVVFGIQ